MKIKNISKGDFNLKSGILKPGKEGECTPAEFKVLWTSNMIKLLTEETPKKAAPKKAKPNG